MLQRCVLVLCVSCLLLTSGVAWSSVFGVTDVTPGWDCASLNPGGALGVNASGQVAGVGWDAGVVRPFLYSGGTTTDLGIGGIFSNQARATGINNAGTMVGWGLVPMAAWYYPSGGAMTTLPYLPSGTSSQAFAINNAGEVGGYSNGTTSSGVIQQATVWNGGAAYDLDTLGSVNGAFQLIQNKVSALSNTGQAVGTATIGVASGGPPTPTFQAVYYTYNITGGVLTGTAANLSSIVGATSYANGINDKNQIVGQSSGSYAYLYNIGGSVTNLGYLGAGTTSWASAINNSGWVVGWSFADAANTIQHAFLYHDGTMTDLNSLISPTSGWELNQAWAVSNTGFIAGRGTIGGVSHGFLLSAMPGDANLDGTVNTSDLSRVLTNYDKQGTTWSDGDFDGNGTVNTSDLSKVLTNYDKSVGFSLAGAKAVPEPSALLMLAAGLTGLLTYFLRRRQR